jgi:anti-sigma B factor antagonist
MANADDYRSIRVKGTAQCLLVTFVDQRIFKADVIQRLGRELLLAADLAARVDMPLMLSFQGVEDISSALIGKLILLDRKAKTLGIEFRMSDIPPEIMRLFP